jgi:hypothetical protein
MQLASNYLYDVTDGYMLIGAVDFYDNKENWDIADIRVYFDPTQTPSGWPGVKDSVIHLPRYFNGASMWIGDPDQAAYYTMFVHEFCHYRYYVLDEYRNFQIWNYNSIGDLINEAPQRIMNNPTFTEFSTPQDYINYNPNYIDNNNFNPADDDLDTEQYVNNNFESCWETVFKMFNSYNGTYMPMVPFDLDNDNVPDTDADKNKDGSPDVLDNYVVNAGPIQNVGANMNFYVHFKPLIIPSWYHETRLSTALGGAHNPRIDANGNNIHVTWWDKRKPSLGSTIYYNYSWNGGRNWIFNQQVSTIKHSAYPDISVSGNVAHMTWMAEASTPRTNWEIYYRNFDTTTRTFGLETRLTFNTNSSAGSKIAANGFNIHVIFLDQRSPAGLYYTRSIDGGMTWFSPTLITSSVWIWYDIEVVGNSVHIVWTDRRYTTGPYVTNTKTFYRNSTNNGQSWNTEVALINATNTAAQPIIFVSQNKLNVFWFDYRNGTNDIYYNSSTNSGISWNTVDIPVITWPTSKPTPRMEGYGNGTWLNLVWMDYRNGYYEVYYNHSTDEGNTWQSADKQITVTNQCFYPDIVVSGGRVFIVWEDIRQGATWAEVYLRYF